MMVAWHEAPGNAAYRSRPVGNGVLGLSPSIVILFNVPPPFLERFSGRDHAEGVPNISDRFLRDGLDNRRFPGTSCLATFIPSLRDKLPTPK